MKKGAIFDQDGLMFDTEVLYGKCWLAVGEELGIDVTDEFFAAVRGSSGPHMMAIVRQFFPDIDADDYVKRVFEKSFLLQDQELPEKKGLRELLAFFKENGVIMTVASSTVRPRVEKNLKKSGLYEYFETLTTGDEVTLGKPDPQIFLKAAAKLGLAPEDCYVFEDSFNGVRAGKAAGCCTVMVPDLIGPDEELSKVYDACCKDLLEVIDLIKADII